MKVGHRALNLIGDGGVVVSKDGVAPAVASDGVEVHAGDREALAVHEGALEAGHPGPLRRCAMDAISCSIASREAYSALMRSRDAALDESIAKGTRGRFSGRSGGGPR